VYEAEISRSNPTAYIFLVDQSGSMDESMASGNTKAQFLSDVINRTLRDLVVRCTREEGVRDYFDVAVIGYGGAGVTNALTGALHDQWLHRISVVADHTARVEDRQKLVDDGGGGLAPQMVKFPVWLDPVADGGTPMREAIAVAARVVADWSDAHKSSFPVTVLNITDGVSTDGDPEHNAGVLRSLGTTDGTTLMYNIHLSTRGVEPLRYPSTPDALPDDYARLLFRMSSTFPEHVRTYARDGHGIVLSPDSRALVLNADAEQLVKFLDIGSRPATMR